MFKIPLFGLSSVFYTSCTKKEPYLFIGKTHKFKNCLNLMTLDEMGTPSQTEEEKAIEASKGKKMPKAVQHSLLAILLAVFFWYCAYNAVTTAFSRYVEQVWQLQNGAYADCLMVGTVAAVVSYLPVCSPENRT